MRESLKRYAQEILYSAVQMADTLQGGAPEEYGEWLGINDCGDPGGASFVGRLEPQKTMGMYHSDGTCRAVRRPGQRSVSAQDAAQLPGGSPPRLGLPILQSQFALQVQ